MGNGIGESGKVDQGDCGTRKGVIRGNQVGKWVGGREFGTRISQRFKRGEVDVAGVAKMGS